MRLRSLDAVRGVAAAVVVLYHALLIIPGTIEDRLALHEHGFSAPFGWIYLTPLRLLVAGPAAVFVFFVLSGFVLTLSLEAGGGETYLSFMIKRVARIWLPFAVVVTMSAALAWLLAGRALPEAASAWMRDTWAEPPTLTVLARHLAMTGTDFSLDNPIWSLIHEMRISVIFPMLVFLMRRRGRLTWAGSLILLLVAVWFQASLPLVSLRRSVATTLCYLPLFLMGISLALYRVRAFGVVARMGFRGRLLLWLLALSGLAYAPIVTSSITRLNDAALLLMNGVAATAVIALVGVDGMASSTLSRALPQRMGRISYSLYLGHVVVFATVLRLFDWEPLWLSIPAAIGIALGVGSLSQWLVERPSAILGQIMAARLARPQSVQSRATAP